MSFEPNRGQVDARIRFLSRASDYSLFLTSTEALLVFAHVDDRSIFCQSPSATDLSTLRPVGSPKATGAAVRMQLIAANPRVTIEGRKRLGGVSNYLIGNDPRRWHTNIPTYAEVVYRSVYPGVDLVYRGNQGQLEYDFVVSPGADPAVIAYAFQGAKAVSIDGVGDLILQTAGGAIRQRKPVVYQEVDGIRRMIAGQYMLNSRNQVRFALEAYDHRRPLTIDPVLVYSTYLGGSGEDSGEDIAIDPRGSVYVSGTTFSMDFPAVNPFQGNLVGTTDAFVTKLDARGSALVYSTYVGGSDYDFGNGIVVDSRGNAYVTGYTSSADFPTLQPLQGSFAGTTDAFVTKLDVTGSALVYSTYLGGAGFDNSRGIAVDPRGNAYVTGYTFSANFPTVHPFQGSLAGTANAFVAKLNVAGSALVYSTYLGGSVGDFADGIAADPRGNAYVTGQTSSADFPTVNPIQSNLVGIDDAFVTKIDATGSALVYSTYLGGSVSETAHGIAVDPRGNAYVTGETLSVDFPTVNPLQGTFGGGDFDAFVTKFDRTGSALVYSTYLGGIDRDFAHGIAVDPQGNAYVTGQTWSADFPTVHAFQGSFAGTADAFVAKLNMAGSALVYSTYLGGSESDSGRSIAVHPRGDAYVTGYTFSTDFPMVNPFQGSPVGSGDTFVVRIAP